MSRPTKKQKVSEEQEYLTLYEKWDVDTLKSIFELETLTPSEEHAVSGIILQYTTSKANPMPGNYNPVNYELASYRTTAKRGPCIQRTPKWILHLCCSEYYESFDLENCGPVLLVQTAQANCIDVPPILVEYTTDRVPFYVKAREQCDLSDKVIKKLFLITLQGGSYRKHLEEELKLPRRSIAVLNQFKAASVLLFKGLWKCNVLRELRLFAERQAKGEDPRGRFVSAITCQAESKVTKALCTFFHSRKLEVGALKFDELLVTKSELLTPTIQDDASVYVYEETGFKIKLTRSSLLPSDEEKARLLGPRSLAKIKTLYEKQIYLLLREGQVGGLKRSGLDVMTPHPNIPGVYVRSEEAVVFINRILYGYHLFRTADMKLLVKWFESIDNPLFEILTPEKMNMSVISFTNGYFDIDSLLFYNWDEVDEPPITDHFFDTEAPSEPLPTPQWDNLLNTQMANEVVEFAEVMIGRLFYTIGKHDNWQVMPFFIGDANTGKGTLVEIVTKMFPIGSIGVITASKEDKFGLESLYDKRAIAIPDLPKRFSTILNQTDFQSMVTGEPVSISRKNLKAISNKDWRAPIYAAGNFLPDYPDASGSVSRRLVVFPFQTLVKERNTQMKRSIIETELPSIIFRCLFRYHNKVVTFPTQDFWSSIAPEALRTVQSEVIESTSFLANFLANGDNYYQVLYVKDAICSLDDLNHAFSMHMKHNHKIVQATIGNDRFPIKAAGFLQTKLKICKVCDSESSRTTCGNHYDSKNRSNKVVFVNMEIKKKPY